ncbi:MAG TPA: SusC/RagA family TonB-linked outer membrane protein [Gemmatimonadales bacterium]|jgi:TonB-linked SusC/RagA family outer membrane protein|nr:SusC/RagA family TonB-linked outer membrane protein [Gemmatimonadales bacterium]
MAAKQGVLVAALLGLLAGTAAAQGRSVSGTVRDSLTGVGIEGARVAVQGTPLLTATDQAGQFTLAGVPAGAAMVLVRAVGYRRREIALGADATTLDVTLTRDVFKLEEVVITGQVTGVARRNLPNAVASLGSEDISIHPTVSLEHQLQGKVAGADIQTNSGAPGGGVQVRLRGVTSINATAEPLFIVDGVIMSDVAIASNANAITGAAGGSNPSLTQDALVNRIADLNPAEIESIEILKGSSAAAIYGGRAANGVVIIRTKRGLPGTTRIELTQRFGYSSLMRKIGSRRFATAAEVDAAYPNTGYGALYCSGGTCPFFDHEEELAGQRKLSIETIASITGGSDNTRYYASGTLQNEPGIIHNTGFDRESIRLNLDQHFSSKLNMQLTTNVLHTRAKRGITNNDNNGVSFYYILTGTPSFVDLRQNPDGTWPDNPFQASNPLATANRVDNKEDVWRFLASNRMQWTPLTTERSSLILSAVGGMDYFIQKNTIFSPPDLQYEPLDGLVGTSLLNNSDNLNLNLDGNAVHTFRGGGFTATSSAGVQYSRRSLDINRITSRNLIAGQSNVSAGTAVTVAENRSQIKNLGFFAQEELLLLNDRLGLTAGIRADQSSLDADPSHLSWFPKVAAFYRIEGGPNATVNEFKLRAAFGQTGNEPLYGQRFTPLNSTQNLGGLPGLVTLGTVGASDLRPERNQEIELGFDGQFLRSRLNVEASVYQKNVKDLLLTRNLPPSSGFAQEIFNGGKLRVRGVEASAAWIALQQRGVQLYLRSTFAKNFSRITELPVPTFQTGGFGSALGAFQIEQGKSATQIVGTDTLASTMTDVVLGDANPDFRMSFTGDLTYKRFTVHALVDWQQGGNVVNLTRLLQDAFGNAPDGDAGNARIGAWAVGQASVYIEPATFAKVREVAVGWEVPPSVMRSLWGGVRSASISLSARNLFWFATPYHGFDPEVSNFGNQPIARNIDVTPYPPSRSFFLTINLGM